MNYETAEDFAQDQPFISPSVARKILRNHGQSLEEFMNDTDFTTERNKVSRLARSTWNNINTMDLIAWLGY